ncbi:MAG: adenylate kinase [Colwellia sp.]|nr:adenylate kinase [Colwellia sp.]
MKLAFTGKSGSGKDYLATHLIDNYSFTRFSFSDQLKKLAHTIYPWLDLDYPPIKKEEKLNVRTSAGEMISHSPRDIWLRLNDLRKTENLIFIRMLDCEISQYQKKSILKNSNIIITDIRSNEEFKWCKENLFKILHICPSKQIYDEYDIDRHIDKNKDYADFTFKNNFNGTDDFDIFYNEHIKK